MQLENVLHHTMFDLQLLMRTHEQMQLLNTVEPDGWFQVCVCVCSWCCTQSALCCMHQAARRYSGIGNEGENSNICFLTSVASSKMVYEEDPRSASSGVPHKHSFKFSDWVYIAAWRLLCRCSHKRSRVPSVLHVTAIHDLQEASCRIFSVSALRLWRNNIFTLASPFAHQIDW